MLRRLAILACILASTGCVPRDVNTWHAPPPDQEKPVNELRPGEAAPRHLAVVFPPVACGPLSAVWPAAEQRLPYDLADRVDSYGRRADADGYAGPTLVRADDPAWTRGPVPEARGAELVVLISVLQIDVRNGASNQQGVAKAIASATVDLRAVNSHGSVVFAKRCRGDWEGFPSAKFPGPESRPEARAAWEACTVAVDTLLTYLEKRNDAESPATVATPVAADGALVTLEIASDPPGADVLVDGAFRGNTPCTLTLPARRLALRLEMPGRTAWERALVPEAGLRIHPALTTAP